MKWSGRSLTTHFMTKIELRHCTLGSAARMSSAKLRLGGEVFSDDTKQAVGVIEETLRLKDLASPGTGVVRAIAYRLLLWSLGVLPAWPGQFWSPCRW